MGSASFLIAQTSALSRPESPITTAITTAAGGVGAVSLMDGYHDLLRLVLERGVRKPTRAKVRGEFVDAISWFGTQTRYDLTAGFPAITTKKLAFGAVAHELLWFLSGSGNIRYLQDNNVKIWDEWADSNGELGPVYGVQWRRWRGADGTIHDQIARLLDGIRQVQRDPRASVGRRLIVNAWNVAEIDAMALPPCHLLFQVTVTGGTLSCQLYQRSADLFLGVPFNIAGYALLTALLAQVTGLTPGEFIHTIGDAHIYENHVDQVREQLSRPHLPPPRLWIDPQLTDLFACRRDQIRLVDYRSHPALSGDVAV